MTPLRTLIRVDISIDQDWAIGAAPDLWFRPDEADVDEASRTTRLPVQRDPSGAFMLPATSLVGSLHRCLGPDADVWLGSQQGSDTVPSELRCLAATIHPADPSVVKMVEKTVVTTAIDAERRAASAGTLRREEVLPPALVTWWLEWDHNDGSLSLDDLVRQLREWRPVVGRRRSADRGRAHVAAVYHRTVDLGTDEGLTWWLGVRPSMRWSSRGALPSPEWRRVAGAQADLGTQLLTRRFMVTDALHLGGKGVIDNEILTGDTVTSTSWRGIFRHRVAHIIRVSTVGPSEEAEQKVTQTVARLFGSGRGKAGSPDSGHRGQLRFGDSVVQGQRQRRTHVAIDRVSGGAAGGYAVDPKDDAGMLFTVYHFGEGATVDLTIYNDSDRDVSVTDRALLEAVIRDIGDGIIGVGGMTSRGYGTLRQEGGQG